MKHQHSYDQNEVAYLKTAKIHKHYVNAKLFKNTQVAAFLNLARVAYREITKFWRH